MRSSPELKDLASALCKAQAQMEAAKKDSTNPHFNSKYADLASVVDAIKVPFSENGLSYVQLPMLTENEEVAVETVLLHSSGQWIASDFAIPVSKADAQTYMSALTYCRRGALSAIAGIAPDDDDDGNAPAAAAPPRRVAQSVPAPQQADRKTWTCTQCGKDTVRASIKGSGYYCFPSSGGCGKTYDAPPAKPPIDAEPAVASEEVPF